jgi:hypothetical protein
MSRLTQAIQLAAAGIIGLTAYTHLASGQGEDSQTAGVAQNQTEESIQYFLEASKTFRHPRCMNCHPSGERPTQGDDMHAHIMNVQRGADDKGAVGMRCASCHNEANNSYSQVPGAPKWALAPKSMAWQGLSDREICEVIKDQKKNHGMSLDELVHHNGEDVLVSWGWTPGANRKAIPGTQKQFGEVIRKWAATGAACPGDDTSGTQILSGSTTAADSAAVASESATDESGKQSESALVLERKNSKKQQTRDVRTIH